MSEPTLTDDLLGDPMGLTTEPDETTVFEPPADTDGRTLYDRLSAIEKRLDSLSQGVNTIGGMMNNVAESFDQIMQQVQKGGIGALLGGMMGGKKDGS